MLIITFFLGSWRYSCPTDWPVDQKKSSAARCWTKTCTNSTSYWWSGYMLFFLKWTSCFFFYKCWSYDLILIAFISVILCTLKMMGIWQYSVVLLIQLVYTVPVLLSSSSSMRRCFINGQVASGGMVPLKPGGCNCSHIPKVLEHPTALPTPKPSDKPPVPGPPTGTCHTQARWLSGNIFWKVEGGKGRDHRELLNYNWIHNATLSNKHTATTWDDNASANQEYRWTISAPGFKWPYDCCKRYKMHQMPNKC